jgi:hypothetical protein
MATKPSNTDRWGGPGASHEDASKPRPPKTPRGGRGAEEPTNTPFSGVSGGGGERDRHHARDTKGKQDTQQNSVQRSKGR